jgi:hypothetical protein
MLRSSGKMSGLSNKAVVDKEQELRPVRFTETGRMRLGKILKAARQETGWSVSETEFKTKGYDINSVCTGMISFKICHCELLAKQSQWLRYNSNATGNDMKRPCLQLLINPYPKMWVLALQQ